MRNAPALQDLDHRPECTPQPSPLKRGNAVSIRCTMDPRPKRLLGRLREAIQRKHHPPSTKAHFSPTERGSLAVDLPMHILRAERTMRGSRAQPSAGVERPTSLAQSHIQSSLRQQPPQAASATAGRKRGRRKGVRGNDGASRRRAGPHRATVACRC